jgi:arginyl-tRNA synthetase
MDIVQTIQERLEKGVLSLRPDFSRERIRVSSTDNSSHGNYTSNIAMQLSGELKQSPRDIAQKIVDSFEKGSEIEKVEIAGPGFINFYLSNQYLVDEIQEILKQGDEYFKLDDKKGKKIVIEYTDPNPFKILHVGHLYTNIVGESFARLQEALGADVKRAIYQGDVGLHVAKTLWGLQKKMWEEKIEFDNLTDLDLTSRVKYLGEAYILGSKYYDELEDGKAQEEIDGINYYIFSLCVPELGRKDFSGYEKIGLKDQYEKGKEWCMAYFETIYKKLGTKFDYYFLESETSSIGLNVVIKNMEKVFKKDAGAVIYEGDESKGLHTRVFINKYGIPTYEAKDLGLAIKKSELIDYDESIIITGKEQAGYFKVVLDALSKIDKDLAEKTTHIPHGLIKSVEGKKLSSRKGVIGGEELIDSTTQQVIDMMKENGRVTEGIEEKSLKIAVAAIKYAFLKVGVGSDIVFDSTKALSFDGDTGPYLLYVHARCKSLLKNDAKSENQVDVEDSVLANTAVKGLTGAISRSKYILLNSGINYSPSTLAQYVFDLAQSFNNFYQQVKILEAPEKDRASLLAIVQATMLTMKNGLELLGIEVVDEM